MHQPHGIFCALWTPLDDQGQVIWKALERQIEFVVGHGVHGMMALGSTGRFYLQSVEQRKKILGFITGNCQEAKLPVVVNVSDTSFLNVVQLAEHARSCWAASMAVLPPWYAPMEQGDITEFFIELARRVPLPLSLYNYPEVTGKRIEIETVQRVASAVPLYAFKQSGGEFGYHKELMVVARARNFALVTGADTNLAEARQIGAAGTISGLANAVPDVLVRWWRNLTQGNSGAEEAETMRKLGFLMGDLPFPLNVKAAMAARGLETGVLINPLSKATRQKYTELEAKIRALYESRGITPAS